MTLNVEQTARQIETLQDQMKRALEEDRIAQEEKRKVEERKALSKTATMKYLYSCIEDAHLTLEPIPRAFAENFRLKLEEGGESSAQLDYLQRMQRLIQHPIAGVHIAPDGYIWWNAKSYPNVPALKEVLDTFLGSPDIGKSDRFLHEMLADHLQGRSKDAALYANGLTPIAEPDPLELEDYAYLHTLGVYQHPLMEL